MRRISIANLMLVIALLAANFSILRFLLSSSRGGRNWHYQLPAGFVPLGDAFILAIFLLLSRNQVVLRRRSEKEPGRFAVPFITALSLLSAMFTLFFFYAEESLSALLRVVATPMETIFKSLGAEINMDTPADRYLIGPIFLGITLSGPPLMIATVFATIMARFKLVITPREEPCVDSASEA
jgi:hypothetical protein